MEVDYSFEESKITDRIPDRYAVVVYLPPELEEVVASLRERFDPDYNLISTHISLVFPFETNKTIDELSKIIRSVVLQTISFTIQFASIGDFYPHTPVIYWRIKENEELNILHKRLYAGLDLPLPHRTFIPHVTVGKEISQHRVVLVKDVIASFLPEESLDVKAIDLVSPVAGDHWVSVRTFSITSA